MEIFGFIMMVYLLTGVVFTTIFWVVLRHKVRQGQISRNDKRLKNVTFILPLLVVAWPYAAWTVAASLK